MFQTIYRRLYNTISIFSNEFIYMIILIALVINLNYYLKWREINEIFDKIPGPRCKPIVGKLFGNCDLIWSGTDTNKLMDKVSEVALKLLMKYQEKGLFRIWAGPFEKVVILFRADTVKPLLQSQVNLDKSKFYKFIEMVADGLITSSGDRWRTHRKLLTPSFRQKLMKNSISMMTVHKNTLISIIDKQLDDNNGVIDDIRHMISNCVLDIVCDTSMGVSFNAQHNKGSTIHESVKRFYKLFMYRLTSPWLWNSMIFNLSPTGRAAKHHISIVHNYFDSVIQKRKSELKVILEKNVDGANEVDPTDYNWNESSPFLDPLLIHYLKNPNQFTKYEIREELISLLNTGSDTTSAAIIFTLVLIGHNQMVQNKINDELNNIFGEDINRDINTEDLMNMSYLEQCIKESLRLYPIVPVFARRCVQPFTVGQYMIPRDTTCVIPLLFLHRDPNVYPNPEIFNPDRFSEDECSRRHSYTYLPFSAGSRNCIGKKFAMMEIKIILASILRKYWIESLTRRRNIKLNVSVTLQPLSKIRMQFKRKN